MKKAFAAMAKAFLSVIISFVIEKILLGETCVASERVDIKRAAEVTGKGFLDPHVNREGIKPAEAEQ